MEIEGVFVRCPHPDLQWGLSFYHWGFEIDTPWFQYYIEIWS